MLKDELAKMGERVTRAREEAVPEYKDQFKDSFDYLDLMRDTVAKHKMAMKKVDPTFDPDPTLRSFCLFTLIYPLFRQIPLRECIL